MAAVTGHIRTTSGVTTEHSSPDSNLDSSRISEVFNKNFLKHAVDKLVLADVAEKFDLPSNAGTMTMRFFRRSEANVDNVAALTEGVATTVFTLGALENEEVTLAQYGAATKISDTRVATDIIKQLELETQRMGEEAALHLDDQIRDAAYDAMHAAAITAASGSGLFIDKNSTTAADRMLTVADLDKAATLLTERRAPMFDGHYMAVVSPRQAYDLRQDSAWINVGTYSDREKIYNGEIGKLYNVKVVVATNPKQITAAIDWNFDGDATDGAGSTVAEAHGLTFETALVFGREFLGTVKLAGSNSPMKPQLIYNDKPDKADPLNQYNVVGWKAYYASMCLNTNFGVVIRSEQNAL
jgi:N4-gp56 family major capsid protein